MGEGRGKMGRGRKKAQRYRRGLLTCQLSHTPRGHPLELLPSQPSTRPSTGRPGGKGHCSTFSGETQQPNPTSGHPQVASPPSAPSSCRDQTGKSQEQGLGA